MPLNSLREVASHRPTIQDREIATERRVLREVLEYQGDRQIVGRTLLEVPTLSRQAHVWTFDDGEHVLLCVELGRYRYWIASRQPLTQLREQACEWLTEPRSGRRSH